MNHTKKVHITIPVLNEEKQLEASVLEILRFCKVHQIKNFELWIADNGSTDRTEEIGFHLQSQFNNVKYIKLAKRGFGLALKAAWSQSQADYLGYMDLDLATDLKHLKQVYDLIQEGTEYTVILGSRLKRGAKVEQRTLLREITSRGLNFLLHWILRVKFTDGMCGFKFIQKSAYDRLATQFKFTDEWFFVTELAVRSEWMGEKVLDLPVRWVDDPEHSASSARLFRLIEQYLIGIERLWREKKRFMAERKRKYPPARQGNGF
jgi:glycosyltransferase involved in cell wall biosynthesis